MDKGSELLLDLNKICVCSPYFRLHNINYTHFILYKTFKQCYGLVCNM